MSDARDIFQKWKVMYDVAIDSADDKIAIRNQCLDELFSMLLAAGTSYDDVLSILSDATKAVTPSRVTLQRIHRMSQNPNKGSFAEYYDAFASACKKSVNRAFSNFYTLEVQLNGVPVKKAAPIAKSQNAMKDSDSDAAEIQHYYRDMADCGITPEEPWYFFYSDGRPKLTPDGKPRRQWGDHKKKNP